MKLTSDSALLSIKQGRTKLATHFEARPTTGPCPENLRIPITIVGYIDGVWGHDDGIDQEFTVTVEHLVQGGLTPGDLKHIENYIEAEHRLTGLYVRAKAALKKLKALVS